MICTGKTKDGEVCPFKDECKVHENFDDGEVQYFDAPFQKREDGAIFCRKYVSKRMRR